MEQQLQNVIEKILEACKTSDRDPNTVKLIAVSKTWSAEEIQPLINLGHEYLGENKLQELEAKASALPNSVEWHYIGSLQRNKVRKVLKYSQWIHSVDNIKLLNTIDRISGEEGHKPNIFLQVNIDEEGSKGGFSPAEIEEVVKLAVRLENINLVGLMCIPEPQSTAEGSRKAFRNLQSLRDGLGIKLPYLSMGMSNDYTVAVEEGATHIRVGSALFGKRPRL